MSALAKKGLIKKPGSSLMLHDLAAVQALVGKKDWQAVSDLTAGPAK